MSEKSTLVDQARKTLAQHLEYTTEVEQLKKMREDHNAELEAIIASGKVEDVAAIDRAGQIQMRLRLIPNKIRQLEESAEALAKAEVLEQCRPLYNLLDREHRQLDVILKRDLPPVVREALTPFLPGNSNIPNDCAWQAVENCLPAFALNRFQPVGALNASGGPVKELAQLVSIADSLDRVREMFFSGGSLNIKALAKIKSLDLLKG